MTDVHQPKGLADKLIAFISRESFRSMDAKYKNLVLKKSLHLPNLDQQFDTLYVYALVEYCIDASHLAVRMFLDKGVKDAFEAHIYEGLHLDGVVGKLVELYKVLKPQHKTQDGGRPLSGHPGGLAAEILKYKSWFDYYKTLAAQPMQKDTFNLNQTMMLELFQQRNQLKKEQDQLVRQREDLEKENRQKSFSYQAEQYMFQLQDDFQQEFPITESGDGKYIPLHGETHLPGPQFDIEEGEAADIVIEDLPVNGRHETFSGKFEEEGESGDILSIIPHEPLDGYISGWLSSARGNLLVLIGEYGTGKTTFCRYLAHQLATGRLEGDKETAISDPKGRMPLLFPFGTLKRTSIPLW